MTPARIGISLAALVAAFGIAFGIGKATGGGEEKAAASGGAERVQLDGAKPRAANLDEGGAIPSLRSEPRRSGGGGGGGGGSASPPPASSPPPSSPPPSSPPPSSPPPSSPPPSNNGGGPIIEG